MKLSKKILALSIALIALVAIGFFAFYDSPSQDPTTNTAESENSESEIEEGQGQATQEPFSAQDTGGQDVDTDSEPINSDSGLISLYSPAENDLVKSGSVISGTAEVDTVVYEIAESGRGLIARGQINVVDGRFSATISDINPSSSEGSLRVFSTDPETLKEANHVNISITLEP